MSNGRKMAFLSCAGWCLLAVCGWSQQVKLMPQLGMGAVTSVAFTPDGKFAVIGETGKTARLWNLATGLQVRAFSGHGGPVYAVAVSPDGKTVLTGSGDHTARLWDIATGAMVRTFGSGEGEVRAVAFSADGKLALTGGFDRKGHLWELATGKELQNFDANRGAVSSIAISADHKTVVTGTWDDDAQVWDAESGKLLHTLSGHTGQVNGVAFSPDGKSIVSGGDNTARLWSTATGELVRKLSEKNDVRAVAFSPDGTLLATATLDGTVHVWTVATGASKELLEGHFNLDSVAFSPDGKYLLAGGGDDDAWRWDVESGKLLGRLSGRTAAVNSISLSPDDTLLATGGDDRLARVWELGASRPVRNFDPHVMPVSSVAFSPDGKQVATGGDRTRLWDIAKGQMTLEFAEEPSTDLAYSPDGRSLVAGNFSNSAKIWDARSGKVQRQFKGFSVLPVGSVAVAKDGRTAASASQDGTARLWDFASGRQLRVFGKLTPGYTTEEIDAMNSVSISPDSRMVLTGEGLAGFGESQLASNVAKVWDAKTGALVRSLKGHAGPVLIARFSPDGRSILTGSADQTMRLWNAADGTLARTMTGHAADITSVAMSKDGHYLFSGSRDTTTRIWDAASGKELAALVSYGPDSWVVTDPAGRFDTSAIDGGAPLAWVGEDDPMRALPLEVFMRDYYTPGLLRRVMNGEKLPAVRAISEIRNRVQPEVAVVGVKSSKTQPGRVDVTVRAEAAVDDKGTRSGLQDLRLFRDGQLVGSGFVEVDGRRVNSGYVGGTLKGGEYTFRDVLLKRTGGKVTFTAYAFNAERIKSATASLEFEAGPAAEAQLPKAYLLQVGVNHYKAQGCELRYSAADAEAMSKALRAKLAGQYEVVPVVLESAGIGTEFSGAGKGAIKAKLAEIAAAATPDDAFFMSFSGHGYSEAGGQFYVLPSDVEGSCHGVTDAMLTTAISADELADWLRPIDAGEMTLILDACYSAESVQAGDFKPGPMGSRGLGQVAYDKRMRVLAASQSDAVAHEYDYLGQGLLTYVLTHDGLEAGKADWKPVDGMISVGEWLSYAADAVPRFKPGDGASKAATAEGEVVKNKALQIPALFDFAKTDTVVLH